MHLLGLAAQWRVRPHLGVEGREHRGAASASGDAVAHRRVATGWTALDRLELRLLLATIAQLLLGLSIDLVGVPELVYDVALTLLLFAMLAIAVAAFFEEEGVKASASKPPSPLEEEEEEGACGAGTRREVLVRNAREVAVVRALPDGAWRCSPARPGGRRRWGALCRQRRGPHLSGRRDGRRGRAVVRRG